MPIPVNNRIQALKTDMYLSENNPDLKFNPYNPIITIADMANKVLHTYPIINNDNLK